MYILFAISIISQYINAPHKVHLEATKHVLHYIKELKNLEFSMKLRIAMAWMDLQTQIGGESARNGNQQLVTYFN
jgi:hypothetical protein